MLNDRYLTPAFNIFDGIFSKADFVEVEFFRIFFLRKNQRKFRNRTLVALHHFRQGTFSTRTLMDSREDRQRNKKKDKTPLCLCQGKKERGPKAPQVSEVYGSGVTVMFAVFGSLGMV